MKGVSSWFLSRFRPRPDGTEALASLIMAAREDAEFRRRLRFVLQLPAAQREPLLRTGVEQMRIQGESAETQAAFLRLASDDGAAVALRLLESE